MTLLSYTELVKLVENGVISAAMENVNGASIDVTLDDLIMVESDLAETVRLTDKNANYFEEQSIINGYDIAPKEFLLASTAEVFNLPDDIVAEFVLKSSSARKGMQHLLAGYADPGWCNSKLTLELVNVNRYKTLTIKSGDKIGQMKFYRVEPVPTHANYAVTGQYNNQDKVQASKGSK